jgi:hypothetical protein
VRDKIDSAKNGPTEIIADHRSKYNIECIIHYLDEGGRCSYSRRSPVLCDLDAQRIICRHVRKAAELYNVSEFLPDAGGSVHSRARSPR